MKIFTIGMWHLGLVTSACLAELGHDVTGYDPDAVNLPQQLPVAETGLPDLIRDVCASPDRAVGLRFVNEMDGEYGAQTADIVWLTLDTPVDSMDRADVDHVLRMAVDTFTRLKDGALFVVSSQLPVGSVARLERLYAALNRKETVTFACVPENLRLGSAIAAFRGETKRVVGVRNDSDAKKLGSVFGASAELLVMSPESAEMTKHARNVFLATQVALTNELAVLCEQVGADARGVERGLRADPRIGPKAFVRAGEAIAGGTLLRDVGYLGEIAALRGVPATISAAVRHANDFHKAWAKRALVRALGALDGRSIALLGVAYKPGTDTKRRSYAVELGDWIVAQGGRVTFYDPSMPEYCASPLDACTNAAAVVVCAPHPKTMALTLDDVRRVSDQLLVVVDIAGSCREGLGHGPTPYICVGQPSTST
jgi:UDPglucose 6-dehydrogenase